MRRNSAQNPHQHRPPESINSRHRLDPVAFAREKLDFHPDPDQALVLDPSIRRGILNCCRQWGKSTTVAVLAVWHAVHTPGSLTIVCAPCARQSAEFVRKAAAFLRRLALPVRGDGDNPISLAFPNGSRIVGLPGEEANIRGFSNVSLLLIDEASRVPDELYHAVRPMVATNERAIVWLMSTPNGRQGFFYEEWTRERSAWTRLETPATRCPRIRAEFLDDERRHFPEQQFRQEYLCEFLAADLAYFDPEAVDDAFRGGTDLPVRPENPHSRFYLGLDLGQARDYSALALAERRLEFTGTHDHATFERHTRTHIIIDYLERIPLRTPYPEVVERVRRAIQRCSAQPRLEILMDATGVGAAVKDMLRGARLGPIIYGVTITGGQHVSISRGDYLVPRHDLLANLRVLLEKRMLKITASGPVAEALRTELNRWGQHSAHDDLVFALSLACWKAAGQPLPAYSGGPLPMYPDAGMRTR